MRRNPLRPLLTWWGNALGALGTLEDVVTTVRDHRLSKASNEELAASPRAFALATARKGCTHTPTCPPASMPDRTRAAEVWSDDACVYLCNGLVLATAAIQAPDSPSGLYTPMPERESHP